MSRVPGIAAAANACIVEKQVHGPKVFHDFIPNLEQFGLDRHVGDDRQHLVVRGRL